MSKCPWVSESLYPYYLTLEGWGQGFQPVVFSLTGGRRFVIFRFKGDQWLRVDRAFPEQNHGNWGKCEVVGNGGGKTGRGRVVGK